MTQDKFYCDNCGVVNNFLIDEREAYCCPNCNYPIFTSEEDLLLWLDDDDAPNHIVPFERSQKEQRK